jgi:hypothetical protein
MVQGALTQGVVTQGPVTQGVVLGNGPEAVPRELSKRAKIFQWVKFLIIEVIEILLLVLSLQEAWLAAGISQFCFPGECEIKYWCDFDAEGTMADSGFTYELCECFQEDDDGNGNAIQGDEDADPNFFVALIFALVLAYGFSTLAQYEQWPARCKHTGWRLNLWRAADLSTTLIMVASNVESNLPEDATCQARPRGDVQYLSFFFYTLLSSVAIVSLTTAIAWCQRKREAGELSSLATSETVGMDYILTCGLCWPGTQKKDCWDSQHQGAPFCMWPAGHPSQHEGAPSV